VKMLAVGIVAWSRRHQKCRFLVDRHSSQRFQKRR
jgi:hypothetical protein